LFNNAGDKLKLLTIAQWGSNKWSSFSSAFYGCINLTGTYIDSPNLSECTSLASMFRNCQYFNSSVDNWNISNITGLSNMFQTCVRFNQPVSSWNTSKVTGMASTFNGCSIFNQSVSDWDIRLVTAMNTMFTGCSAYSTTNYNALLIAWSAQTVKSAVTFAMNATTKYSAGAAATARGVLTNAPNSWVITDGGQA
jgi:surface protein